MTDTAQPNPFRPSRRLLDADYWDQRYRNSQTGWDASAITTPLQAYIDQLDNPDLHILIPGAGNAYEAEYLYDQGFENVYVLDWSEEAVRNFLDRVPDFPADQVFQEDFFEHRGQYDLILEQTFFSALHPSKRRAYAMQMYRLLAPKGKLVGVLFEAALNQHEPPFGGNRGDYLPLFTPFFKPKAFKRAFNSIPPRQGYELFINLVRKTDEEIDQERTAGGQRPRRRRIPEGAPPRRF